MAIAQGYDRRVALREAEGEGRTRSIYRGRGGVCPLAGVREAALDDPRFEPERLRAAARAVLGPLEQVRSDDELVALWRERFERWLPVGWRRWRLPGVPGGWGADVVIGKLEVVALRNVGVAQPAEAVVAPALVHSRRLDHGD